MIKVERSDRTSTILPEGRIVEMRPNQTYGQAKYAVRGMGPSIYQDKTRYTKDDYEACEVSDKGAPALDNYRDD